MKCSDPSVTKWAFDCVTDSKGKPPAGGLVLQNITHDDHNFAKDIRLIGLWIETEPVDPTGAVSPSTKKFYVLDAATFTVSSVTTLVPKPTYNATYKRTFDYLKEADAALDFTDYFKDSGNYVAYGVSATFDAPALLSGLNNCEYAGLSVEQIFLFSRYGRVPMHEPSGGLDAARCHPMVRYRFSTNPAHDPKKKFTRVRTIRFDYRLYLYLDRHFDVSVNKGLPQLGNQAGIFADSDSKNKSRVVGFGSGVTGLVRSGSAHARAITAGAFTSVEKPVLFEVMAPGLGKGFPRFEVVPSGGGSVNVRGWDNVHWWGSRGATDPIISAPGAFHCAHLHWRWGAAGVLANSGTLGAQFNPTTYPKGISNPATAGMWGPLVDPAIWIQTLRVAITKNDPKLDPAKGVAQSALSMDDWASLFEPGLRSTPDDISKGDDLVLWYSAQVHRDLSDPTLPTGSPYANPKIAGLTSTSVAPGGTVFIHGIFFAHSAEITGSNVGGTAPAYWPNSEKAIRAAPAWTRPAE